MKKSSTAQCAKAVALFRGLYARVAQNLGVDASYISRIAHGKRKSKVAEKALVKEFNKVVSVMRNHLFRSGMNPHVEITLRCPSCKTVQKAHIAARAGSGLTGSERIPCINCDARFKVTIPDKIIGGRFRHRLAIIFPLHCIVAWRCWRMLNDDQKRSTVNLALCLYRSTPRRPGLSSSFPKF